MNLVEFALTPKRVFDSVNRAFDVIMISRRPGLSNPAFTELCELLHPVDVMDFKDWSEIEQRLSTLKPVVFAGGTLAVVEAVSKAKYTVKRGKGKAALILTFSSMKELENCRRHTENVQRHCNDVGIMLFGCVVQFKEE